MLWHERPELVLQAQVEGKGGGHVSYIVLPVDGDITGLLLSSACLVLCQAAGNIFDLCAWMLNRVYESWLGISGCINSYKPHNMGNCRLVMLTTDLHSIAQMSSPEQRHCSILAWMPCLYYAAVQHMQLAKSCASQPHFCVDVPGLLPVCVMAMRQACALIRQKIEGHIKYSNMQMSLRRLATSACRGMLTQG